MKMEASRSGIPVAALTLVAAVMSGCSGEPGPQAFAGARRDSVGVEIVEHSRVTAYGGRTCEMEYLLVIYDTLPSGAGEFGRVTDAELLPDGSLAVLDEASAEVRVFSPEGAFVRRIGRKGEGPGELSGGGTLGLLTLSSGRIALPDIVNQTILVFDTAGTYIRGLHWDLTGETIPEWRPMAGDTVMVRVETEETNTFVKRTLDGTWRDTVAVQGTPSPPRSPGEVRGPVFADRIVWSASAHPDRLALSWMATPNLRLLEGGTLRRVIRWTPNDLELTEEERDLLMRVVARAMGDPNADPQSALRYFTVPERLAAIADVELGPGIVMAQRLRPFAEMDRRILSTVRAAGLGGPTWDVFSWSGEYLGILDFGANVEVFRVRGDSVVGVREDSLGVAYPFLARIPGELVQRGALPERGR